MKILSTIILLGLTSVTQAASCPSKSKDASEWVKYADSQMRGSSSDGKLTMDIETPEWKRTMEINAKVSGKDKSIVFIEAPAKEKGMGTLRLEMKMWNYLPKLRKTVTISPSMLLSSWMGSDFSNDDLLKASSMPDDYHHKFLADEKMNGETYKIVEHTSKDNSKVIWPKILVYYNPKDCLPRVQKYFNNGGNLVRTLTLSEIKKMDGHEIPTFMVMQYENEKNKKTTLRYNSMDYDINFSDKTFTLQNLSK